VTAAVRRNARPYLVLAVGAGLATLCVYVVGVPWLAAVTHMGLARGAAVGALPFIPGDVLKAAVAVPLIWAVDRAVTRVAPASSRG
jgi:biotin transport system substrate-specific component